MRVVGVDEFGGPEAFKIFELPDPQAGPGQVRIRVHAATVNPTDTFTRNGARAEMLKEFPPPYVPGMDAAGVIDQVGEGVAGFRPGDHVMAVVIPRGSHGAYSELIVLPSESVAHAPAGASDVEASTLPMNGLTARLSLDLLGLEPGQTIAVTGAAGCYGGYMVQLAKADGLRVIADAAPADVELVRSLGADIVVPRGDDVAARIRDVVPEGVDAVADGSVQNTLVLPAIKDGGAVASIRPFQGETERGIALHMVWVREYWKEQAKLDALRQQVEDGELTLRVARTFSPEETGEAHRILEAGGTRGRLVIDFAR